VFDGETTAMFIAAKIGDVFPSPTGGNVNLEGQMIEHHRRKVKVYPAF
jgi:hypothetical protein